jgi:hypothetical protein
MSLACSSSWARMRSIRIRVVGSGLVEKQPVYPSTLLGATFRKRSTFSQPSGCTDNRPRRRAPSSCTEKACMAHARAAHLVLIQGVTSVRRLDAAVML